MTTAHAIAAALIAAIRALPAAPVMGWQPEPHTDSHSYATWAEAEGPGDAWAVVGLAHAYAEAADAADAAAK